MNDNSTVNSQIVDSVNTAVSVSSGQSPSQAFGMLNAVLLETLGMAMHNAVNRQQSASMISSAAVTAACARMLTAQARVVPPPPPAPGPPPVVNPLPGPPPESATPAVVIAGAVASGEAAIQVLKAQANNGATDAALAQAGIAQLVSDAAPPPAPIPPAPPAPVSPAPPAPVTPPPPVPVPPAPPASGPTPPASPASPVPNAP